MLFVILSALPDEITKHDLLRQIKALDIDTQELSLIFLKSYKSKINSEKTKKKFTKAYIQLKSDKNISSVIANLNGAKFSASNSSNLKENAVTVATCTRSPFKTDLMKLAVENKDAGTLEEDEDFKQYFEHGLEISNEANNFSPNEDATIQSKISEYVSSRLQVIDVKKAKQRERAKARARAKRLEAQKQNSTSQSKNSPKSRRSKGGYRIVTSKSKGKGEYKQKGTNATKIQIANPSG